MWYTPRHIMQNDFSYTKAITGFLQLDYIEHDKTVITE